jgi:catechol 2,3-dioxygenase-like lactoylglutathione lyase family enzyme
MAGAMSLLRRVDAVTVPVPDLDAGLAFYCERLGHRMKWRDDSVGAAGLALPDGDSELVLTTRHGYEPNWLVEDVPSAIDELVAAGATSLAPIVDIPVGRVGVVQDPFGNVLVLVDLSKGLYPEVGLAT